MEYTNIANKLRPTLTLVFKTRIFPALSWDRAHEQIVKDKGCPSIQGVSLDLTTCVPLPLPLEAAAWGNTFPCISSVYLVFVRWSPLTDKSLEKSNITNQKHSTQKHTYSEMGE